MIQRKINAMQKIHGIAEQWLDSELTGNEAFDHIAELIDAARAPSEPAKMDRACPDCAGTGDIHTNPEDPETCPTCCGSGRMNNEEDGE